MPNRLAIRLDVAWYSVIFTIVVVLLGVGILHPYSLAAQLNARVQYQYQSYLLGPGDVLKIQVVGEPEYTDSQILVHPDGHAVFSGIGEIDVMGRTVSDVTDEITGRFKRILVDPRVTVALAAVRPATLYVLGAVKHPGVFQVRASSDDHDDPRTNPRLSNMLAKAGGALLNADLANVKITRTLSSSSNDKAVKTETFTVDLWRLLKNGEQDQDILLQPGDLVEVPELQAMALSDGDFDVLLRSSLGSKDFPVRVIGEVKSPGVYYLDGTSPFLNSAIAKAGGFEPQANRKVVAVSRFCNERQSLATFFIAPQKGEIYLRPNDVVFISENRIYKSGRLFQQVAHILAPFQSAAATGSSTAQIFGLGGWYRFTNK